MENSKIEWTPISGQENKLLHEPEVLSNGSTTMVPP